MYLLGNPFLPVEVKYSFVIVPLVELAHPMHSGEGFSFTEKTDIADYCTSGTVIPLVITEIHIKINKRILYGADRVRNNHPDTDGKKTGNHND